MLVRKRIPVRFILNEIKWELLFVSIISFTVIAITKTFKDFLPEMPLTVPAFIGTAISVLLSFNLNQSYERWWEARIIWGAIVNNSRSLVLQLQSLVADGNDDVVRRMAYRQIAWCYSLGQSLRGLDPTDNIQKYITADDMDGIKKHDNKPIALSQLQVRELKALYDEGQIDTFSRIQIDTTIEALVAEAGKAERINSTVFPVTYRIFLHFIIYLFIATLSIALDHAPPAFVVPLLLIIASAFFLLENTATHMQDPFENTPTDTAVTAIATTIEINIKNLLNDKNVPAKAKPEKFYLM